MRRILLLLSLFVAQAAVAATPELKDGFFRTSDGVKLHYLEAGSGQGIFFEPGWTMPAWIWDAQIRHFAQHYHVVALDPRSQGESEKANEGNSCERRAQDIKELMEKRKMGPVVLVGWSLGVSEVLTYAEQFGGSQVQGYVLVDGSVPEKIDPQSLVAMVGVFKEVQTNRKAFTERFVRSIYRKEQPEEYLQRVIAASLKMPGDSAIAASVSAISRPDWRPALAKVDKPVLVVCQSGREKIAINPVVAAIPAARAEVFEDAGHALFVDDAERFNSVLEEFIKHLPQP